MPSDKLQSNIPPISNRDLVDLSIEGKREEQRDKKGSFWSNWKFFTLREDCKKPDEMAVLPIKLVGKLEEVYGRNGPPIHLWNWKNTHGVDYSPIKVEIKFDNRKKNKFMLVSRFMTLRSFMTQV